MTWTKEQPTAPGWYWWRSAPYEGIHHYDLDENGECYCSTCEDGEVQDGEWAGPIEPPEEE